MIKEDFVSFETGKLLEEKGFPINEFHKGEIGVFNGIAVSKITKEMVEKEMCSCIPQSAVMKWLREVHNLHVTIPPYNDSNGIVYHYEIFKLGQVTASLLQEKTGFENVENACKEAINYCLMNLI